MKRTLMISRGWGGMIGHRHYLIFQANLPVENETHMDPGLSEVRTTGLPSQTHVWSSPTRKLTRPHRSTSHAWSVCYFFINKCSELLINARSWRALNWYI